MSNERNPKATYEDYEVYKIQSSIYFANSEKLKRQMETAASQAHSANKRNWQLTHIESFNATKDLIEPTENEELNNISTSPNQAEAETKHIIFDMAAVNQLDSDGVKMLEQLVQDFKAKNISVYFCQFQGD